jgi:glycosyltransferase involved in cell wall biosynthesis
MTDSRAAPEVEASSVENTSVGDRSVESASAKVTVVSIVIPVYNEEEVLSSLFEDLTASLASLDIASEVIFVNDGSSDGSAELLRQFCLAHPRSVLITLSRNFGHQASITAGLQAATGDCVIIMDADLQDPPSLIPALLQRWRAGDQIVIAHRRSRGERLVRRLLFAGFYRVLSLLSDHPLQVSAGVFGLMDRKVVDGLLRMSEQNRFIPGMRSWVGFKQGIVVYDRRDRAAGEAKQTLGKLFRYAFDAIFSFSYKPLRVIWVLGSLVSAFCFLYAVFLMILRILQINVVAGFTTPAVAILFLGGVQLVAIGILGEYLGRIYDEVKRRPLFIIENELRHSEGAVHPEPDGAA